jgi:hypothetical protein
MNRPLVILLGVLMLGAAIFAGSYAAGRRACATVMRSTDDLSWLRSEFHLRDADMAHVRQLHEGYLPQCMKMCAKLAAKKAEVADMLANPTSATGCCFDFFLGVSV